MLLVTACSSSSGDAAQTAPKPGDGTTPPGEAPPPASAGDETWADGKSLSGTVAIPAGTTITIAPGAKIAVASGTTIKVSGKLVAASDGTHAKIGGAAWKGIVVDSGGDAELDGVDFSDANVAVSVDGGGNAKVDHATIVGTPFAVAKGGKLSTAHATVTKPDTSTNVSGSFTASFLDYDENDQHAIIADDPSAVLFIEDSTFKNSGRRGPTAGPDVLTVNDAASFHLAYSDVSGAHCGFHFLGGQTFEIDHVTVHDVTNGADVWGSSSTGKMTITASNFEKMLSVAFDESGANGSVVVTGSYVPAKNNLASPSKISFASPANASIADAKPR